VARLLVLLCAMWSVGASAQELAPTQDAARGHFKAGSAYFERREYDRAIKEFLEAQREVDVPALDYNLALAYERLGDAARAVRAYERFLARSPESTNRATVERAIVRLDGQIGMLIVDPTPAPESVRVDDTALVAGDERVTEGRHRVSLQRDGVTVRSISVQVRAGGRTRVTAKDLHPPARWWIGVAVGSAVVVAGLAIGLGVGLGASGTAPARMGSVGSLGVP